MVRPAIDIPRRRFTTAEYHRMGEAGIFGYDERLELLDGDVFVQGRIRPPHASCVMRTMHFLLTRLDEKATIRTRAPIVLGRYSEPEPDVSVLVRRDDFYAAAHPRPRDTLLVIEVLSSPESYDRVVKLPLYARAGIREVWLADPIAKTIEVHRGPALRGYREKVVFGRDDTSRPLAFPRLRARGADFLG